MEINNDYKNEKSGKKRKKEIAIEITNSGAFPGISKSTIEDILDSFLFNIKKSVLEGYCVSFPGYFNIRSKWTKERPAIDMKTIRDPVKKKIIIPSMLVPKVEISESFEKEMKNEGLRQKSERKE